MKKITVKKIATQKGSSLFMTLVLLLAFSILGINSMKGTGIHTRIAANHVAVERTFQAAESGIDRVYLEGNQPGTDRFIKAMILGSQQDCMSRGGFLPNKCTNNDAFDSYGNFSSEHGNTLLAATQTRHVGTSIAAGYDTRNFVFQRFETRGAGFFKAERGVGFATENQLNWKRFSPKGSFSRNTN